MTGPYEVVYARSVLDFMLSEVTSRKVYERIDAYRKVLTEFPYLGEEYDPYYEAARPPFPCRFVAVPGTPFALYYAVSETTKTVQVFAIEDQHRDPRGRFAG